MKDLTPMRPMVPPPLGADSINLAVVWLWRMWLEFLIRPVVMATKYLLVVGADLQNAGLHGA